MPQTWPSSPEKRNWLNGMRISASQPCSSMVEAPNQTGSQLSSQSPPSLEMASSPRPPDAVRVKENAVRLSW